MRKLWGFPVKDLGWKHEDGKPFDPDAAYPVVDVVGNRVYTIDKADESSVSVLQSYSTTSQPGAALNFALMTWGNPASWERPDISDRVVSCLGAPACTTCVEIGQPFSVAPANEWRLTRIEFDDTWLGAKQLVDSGDPVKERLTDLHAMAEIDALTTDDYRKELFRRAIILFGAPYDLATATPSDPMITALNMLPRAIDPRVAAHPSREKDSKQDIYGPLNRLHD